MKSYYFTKKINPDSSIWGYVEVVAENSTIARQLMVDKYGLAWGFEYDAVEEIHPLDRTKLDSIVQKDTFLV